MTNLTLQQHQMSRYVHGDSLRECSNRAELQASPTPPFRSLFDPCVTGPAPFFDVAMYVDPVKALTELTVSSSPQVTARWTVVQFPQDGSSHLLRHNCLPVLRDTSRFSPMVLDVLQRQNVLLCPVVPDDRTGGRFLLRSRLC